MTDPVTQQPAVEPSPEAAELVVLKAAHQEILVKRSKDKARIAELEIASIALQDKATKAESAAQDALTGAPLRRMAAIVSDVPELFLSEFGKHYAINADKDGNISVNSLDGKPAIDRDGKPVEFTPHSLYSLLASQAVVAGGAKDARSKTFAVLMKYFGASGAAGTQGSNRVVAKKTPFQFGLK